MTWIKLYHEFLGWEWFSNPQMVQLFIWMLLKASPTDRQWQGVTILRGQLLTTYSAIERETGMTHQQARTNISRLKSTGEITIKSTNRFSLITICNYETYQNKISLINQQINQQSNQQTTNKQPTSNQRCTDTFTVHKTIKNIDNITTTSTARAREEKFIDQMKTEQIWLEAMAKNFSTDVQDIIRLLDEFNMSNECRDITHKDISDARRHFNDWLYKRQAETRRNGKDNAKIVNELWQ